MPEQDKDERVSEHTKELLKKAGYRPRPKKIEHKHYKKDAVINMDYNLLENVYVVRKFVQKKFDMTLRDLELLLYLFPKGYFSHRDYKNFPLAFSHRQISSMINKNYVKVFKEGKNKEHHIYTLTKSAKHIVIVYYKYLSGELSIPTTSENNPMVRKDATSHEKKIIRMFEIMRKANRNSN